MKRLFAVLLIMCFVLCCAAGCGAETQTPAEETAVPEVQESAAPITIRTIDYDALYELHEDDYVVMTINGEDIAWDVYFYVLFTQAQTVQSHFESMAAYYGMAADWEDPYDDEGNSFIDMVISSTEDSLKQLVAIETFEKENDVELSQEILDQIKAQEENDIITVCGEDGTREDFDEYLKSIHMSRSTYELMNRLNFVYQQNYIQIYGELGEKLDEETAMDYLESNSYISANHILFLTKDMATGEDLDESVAEEKKATAEKLAKELQAITDTDELLEKFAELKAEYCEDTGKTYYAEGYTFTPGTMVAEFEDTCLSLEPYGVSDPVQSSYGYHIIMSLPLDPDAVIEYSNSGTAMNAYSYAANDKYMDDLNQLRTEAELVFAEDFEQINLLEFIK